MVGGAKRWSVVFVVAITSGGLAVAVLAATRAATELRLVYNGRHEAVPVSDTFPLGVRHVGSFTARGPFCEGGTAVDLRHDHAGNAERRYTCSDGSGTLTLAIQGLLLEHGSAAPGEWRVVEGTGRYEGLRGRGTFRGELVGGTPGDLLSIVFRASAQGVADKDDVAPAAAVSTARAMKLSRPARSYVLRLTLSLRDAPGNAVSYALQVTSREGVLAARSGTTTRRALPVTVRVRPSSSATRTVRVVLTAADPVGNERRATRVVRLPR